MLDGFRKYHRSIILYLPRWLCIIYPGFRNYWSTKSPVDISGRALDQHHLLGQCHRHVFFFHCHPNFVAGSNGGTPNWFTAYNGRSYLNGCFGGRTPPNLDISSQLHFYEPLLVFFLRYLWHPTANRQLCDNNMYAQIRTFARSLCFLARKGPSFPRTPTKSAKGCRRKWVWNEPWSKIRVVRGARGHN
jgi:hypothetical protein